VKSSIILQSAGFERHKVISGTNGLRECENHINRGHIDTAYKSKPRNKLTLVSQKMQFKLQHHTAFMHTCITSSKKRKTRHRPEVKSFTCNNRFLLKTRVVAGATFKNDPVMCCKILSDVDLNFSDFLD